jgi:hypothetical protein
MVVMNDCVPLFRQLDIAYLDIAYGVQFALTRCLGHSPTAHRPGTAVDGRWTLFLPCLTAKG